MSDLCRSLCVCALALLASPHSAASQQSTPEVEWQVVQPFRFLRFKSDHAIHELAWRAASQQPNFKRMPVSTMEALLNNRTWWQTPIPQADGKTPKKYIDDLRASDLPAGQQSREPATFETRQGWASLLRNQNNGGVDAGTCWNADRQDFLNCLSTAGDIRGGEEYVHPRHHIVQIRIDGTGDVPDEQTCRLELTQEAGAGYGFLENNQTSGSRELDDISFDCNAPVLARVPYEGSLSVKASTPSGWSREETIAVRDILVASMGDSFASGEGNPDVVARLDRKAVVRPRTREDGVKESLHGLPKRAVKPDGKIAPGTHARWLDQRCHRSMYSAHSRAAIALALAGERHHAVTFVSYACSGAEITDGLFWSQDGRECTSAAVAGSRHMEPQISAMVNALRTTSKSYNRVAFDNTLNRRDHFRRKQLKLLSEGGWAKVKNENDYCDEWPNKLTRFRENPLLRYADVERKVDLLYLSIGGNDIGFAPLVTGMVLTNGFTTLPLQDKMAKFYSIAAGGIDKDEAEDRLSVLPDRYEMLRRGIVQKLEMAETELDRVFITEYPNPSRNEHGALCTKTRKGMNVSRFFELSGEGSGDGLVDIAEAQSVIAQLNEKVRSNTSYTVVGDFGPRFETHGICAGGASAADEFDLPHKRPDDTTWKVFDPITGLHLYAPRQRWFRTFNDSYTSIQYFKGNAYEEDAVDDVSALYLAYRSLGGPVHPSAEGHAAIADSLYCASIRKLFPGKPEIQCN